MSHISQYNQKITDISILKSICLTKSIPYQEGIHRREMFGTQTQEGIFSFTPESWEYPIVIDKNGNLNYDNFGSKKNSMADLALIMQDYNVAVIEKNLDHSTFDHFRKTVDENGDIIIELITY